MGEEKPSTEGVIVEPDVFDLDAWLEEMDAIGDSFEIERDQPPPHVERT